MVVENDLSELWEHNERESYQKYTPLGLDGVKGMTLFIGGLSGAMVPRGVEEHFVTQQRHAMMAMA